MSPAPLWATRMKLGAGVGGMDAVWVWVVSDIAAIRMKSEEMVASSSWWPPGCG